MGASQSVTKTNTKNNTKKNNIKNNTKKNNNQAPVIWNGKVLPPATPANQKSNINSNWKPATNKNARKSRKTRKNRK
jgi:hypothetical protein